MERRSSAKKASDRGCARSRERWRRDKVTDDDATPLTRWRRGHDGRSSTVPGCRHRPSTRAGAADRRWRPSVLLSTRAEPPPCRRSFRASSPPLGCSCSRQAFVLDLLPMPQASGRWPMQRVEHVCRWHGCGTAVVGLVFAVVAIAPAQRGRAGRSSASGKGRMAGCRRSPHQQSRRCRPQQMHRACAHWSHASQALKASRLHRLVGSIA